MADEEKALDLELEEEGQKKSKLWLIIAAAVVLLIIIVVTVLLLFSGGDDSMEVEEQEEAVEHKEPAMYIPLRPAFIINFMTEEGKQRYLQVEITIMTRSQSVSEVLTRHMPLVRNNLISILSSQEFEEIMTNEGKETLRETALSELQLIVEEEAGQSGIEKVLFTSFVIQ